MARDIIWVASFDIGKKNFSFYIEEFDKKIMTSLPKSIKGLNPDGTVTVEYNNTLETIYKTGTKILLENVDLTHGCDHKLYLDQEVMHNMTDLLEEYNSYWDQCDVFIIEKQMSFGKKHNTMALKLGQHCWSYFACKYRRTKELVEFPAYHKTQVLGAPKDEKRTKAGKISYKAVDKPTRKKWCITEALRVLAVRDDADTISQIQSVRKKDDLCDVICQLQAFKYCMYVNKSI